MAAQETAGRPPRLDTGPILVAVNGHDDGWHSVEWAAAKASARQCELRIVHAISWPLLTLDAFGFLSVNQLEAGAAEAAEHVVDEAAGRAHMIAPGVQVTTHLQAGPTAAAILREGRRDALIVLGRGPETGRLSSFKRSVGWQVARHATCPVAFIELLTEPSRGPSAGRVVVGVGGTGEPAAALGFAFRAAQSRGVGITALQSPVDLDGQVHYPRTGESFIYPAIEDALRRCRGAFPDVDVRRRMVPAPAGPALVAESKGASMVVLASAALRARHRTTLESVEQTVFRSAHSPVAIVQTPKRRRRGLGKATSRG